MSKIAISALWHDYPETIVSFYNNLRFAMLRHNFELCISLSPNIKSKEVKKLFHETIPENLTLIDVDSSRRKYTSDILAGHLQNFQSLSKKGMDFFMPLASNCMFIKPIPINLKWKNQVKKSEFGSVFQNRTNTWPEKDCMSRSSDFVKFCKSNQFPIYKQLHEGTLIPFDFLEEKLTIINTMLPQGDSVNYDQYPVEEYIIPTLFYSEYGYLPRQFIHFDWEPDLGIIDKLNKSDNDASHGIKRVSREPESEIRLEIEKIYSSPGEQSNPVLLHDFEAIFSVSKKIDFRYSKSEGVFQRDYSAILKNNFPIEFPKTGFRERGMRYTGEKISPDYTNHLPRLKFDKACVVYSNLYGVQNYEHFILDVIPRIWVIWKYFRTELSNYHFIIQESKFSELCREILDIFDIEENKIVVIDQDSAVEIGQGIVFTSFYTYPFNLSACEFLWDFRNQIKIKSDSNLGPKKKIYLSRGETQNTGLSRKIINSDELNKLLSEHGFDTIVAGNLSLVEKFNLISNSDVVFSEIGANCLNILLAEKVDNLVTIGHNKWKKRFYNDVFKILNPLSSEKTVFGETEPKDYNPFDDVRGVNVPWIADLEKISEILQDIEN